eukprot:scaffold827_cov36-Phaeocystis_antarctica.AAC.2
MVAYGVGTGWCFGSGVWGCYGRAACVPGQRQRARLHTGGSRRGRPKVRMPPKPPPRRAPRDPTQ